MENFNISFAHKVFQLKYNSQPIKFKSLSVYK